MIDHMREERLALLGQLPSAAMPRPTPSAVCPPSPEPSAAERRDRPGRFMGNNTAFDVLPALGLDFATLEQRYLESRKPALDVGASFSTVALQATFHSIPVHSTDLRCNTNRHIFLSNILRAIEPFRELYSASGSLPEGFKCAPIEAHQWNACLEFGIKQVDERMVQCAADRIVSPSGEKARDRSFSVVFSHHAVPKYSTTDFFLSAELPELLRVTDHELRLYPLISAGPGDELLHVRLSENRRRLESVASQLGFDLEIKVSPTAEGKLHRGEIQPGFDMLGVFRRL